MAQCEKIIQATGERCSNPAIPGSRFCSQHQEGGRITFRRLGSEEPESLPPAPEPTTSRRRGRLRRRPAAEATPPEWQAQASSMGADPAFPSIYPDDRDILVGHAGIIWLPDLEGDVPFERLGRLIGFLSQAFPLEGQSHILVHRETDDILVQITPADPDDATLSTFYNSVSDAARLVRAWLFVGESDTYVQYRNSQAPRGYDIPDYEPHELENHLILVDTKATRCFDIAEFEPISLADFCMRIQPQPDVAGPPPPEIYALAPVSFALLLARYFRAHHLRYEIARIHANQRETVLFQIQPNPEARADTKLRIGPTIPAFVINYLESLPRVVVLSNIHEYSNTRFLLQWGKRYPARLENVDEAFGEEDLVLLVANEFYSNQWFSPAPTFFDGDQLVSVPTESVWEEHLIGQRDDDDTPELSVPVLLRPSNGETPPTNALLLRTDELAWLQQLLYRLPGDAFRAYTLWRGADLSMLLGTTREIRNIPFGIPFRSWRQTDLYIPLRSRITPDLPWSVLRQVFQIEDNTYSFFLTTHLLNMVHPAAGSNGNHEYVRFSLPASEFVPLSQVLVEQAQAPQVSYAAPQHVELPLWTVPPVRKVSREELEAAQAAEREERSLFRRLLGGQRGQQDDQEAAGGSAAPQRVLETDEEWREQARRFEEEEGDYTSAAICYALANDKINSARCYRHALSNFV